MLQPFSLWECYSSPVFFPIHRNLLLSFCLFSVYIWVFFWQMPSLWTSCNCCWQWLVNSSESKQNRTWKGRLPGRTLHLISYFLEGIDVLTLGYIRFNLWLCLAFNFYFLSLVFVVKFVFQMLLQKGKDQPRATRGPSCLNGYCVIKKGLVNYHICKVSISKNVYISWKFQFLWQYLHLWDKLNQCGSHCNVICFARVCSYISHKSHLLLLKREKIFNKNKTG